MNAARSNQALSAICHELLSEWKLTPQEIRNLAADLPGECDEMAKHLATIDAMERAESEFERASA